MGKKKKMETDLENAGQCGLWRQFSVKYNKAVVQ